MTAVVVDTDVASAIIKGRLPDHLDRVLAGQRLAITFVAVGELTQWAHLHRWGDAGRLRGRRRPVNDSWVAACRIARDLPLMTLNTKDYLDFAEHEGLELLR